MLRRYASKLVDRTWEPASTTRDFIYEIRPMSTHTGNSPAVSVSSPVWESVRQPEISAGARFCTGGPGGIRKFNLSPSRCCFFFFPMEQRIAKEIRTFWSLTQPAHSSSTSPDSKRARKSGNHYLRMMCNAQVPRSPENVSSHRDARGEVTWRWSRDMQIFPHDPLAR